MTHQIVKLDESVEEKKISENKISKIYMDGETRISSDGVFFFCTCTLDTSHIFFWMHKNIDIHNISHAFLTDVIKFLNNDHHSTLVEFKRNINRIKIKVWIG